MLKRLLHFSIYMNVIITSSENIWKKCLRSRKNDNNCCHLHCIIQKIECETGCKKFLNSHFENKNSFNAFAWEIESLTIQISLINTFYKMWEGKENNLFDLKEVTGTFCHLCKIVSFLLLKRWSYCQSPIIIYHIVDTL